MKVAEILKTVQTFTNEHRSEILTGVGIAGMLTTVGLAIKATPKAMELIEEKKEELDTDELTKGEIVKVAWKPYIPTVIVGTLSTVCLIGACAEGAKRTAALATACKLSEPALSEYKDFSNNLFTKYMESYQRAYRGGKKNGKTNLHA